nr:hypothetical protein [Tanacetum cinerariifolium]
MEDLKQQYLDEMKSLINSEYRDEIKINELKGNFIRMSIEINKKEKLQQLDEFNPIHNEDLDYSLKNDHFNTKSYLFKSLLNRDTLMASSYKIDYLLDEFAAELIFLKSIPPGIDEADCEPEEDIYFFERLLYDNSSPQPLEEFNSEKSDAIIESFSPSPIPAEDSDPFMEEISPIPVENSDSLVEEIDLTLTPDDSMPPSIENDDYDSERDILILEGLLSNNSLSLPENESFHFDITSSPRPPAKPLDDDEIKPNSGILTVKMVGDISEQEVPMPRLFPTQPTLASNQEKSPHLLSPTNFLVFCGFVCPGILGF